MYYEYDPDHALRPYIHKYWVARDSFAEEYRMKVYPDGCVDIIFAFGSSASARSMREAQPYLVGTYTAATTQLFYGEADMLGVRFRPAGVTAFIRGGIDEFTNIKIELSLLDTLFERTFFDRLADMERRRDQLILIDEYLLSRLAVVSPADPRILHGLHLIETNKGVVSPADIARETCLCLRQFERKFKAAIGITPKNFARIVRFNHTRHWLQINPEATLLEIAADCGYYDHAHLIREFSELSGESPSRFRE